MLEEQQSIKEWVGRTRKSSLKIERIPGDASSRHYYRIYGKETSSLTTKKAQSQLDTQLNSMIAMKMAPYADQGDRLSFIQVQRHLANLGVNTPSIIDLDPEQGLILLSDLGDETLLKRLETVSKKSDQLVWFKSAIDLLLEMQTKATAQTAPIDAYGLYFDEEKLMWEVNFTLNHFYNGKLAREIPPQEISVIQQYFSAICKRLSSRKWYFTHRDYHSRNIMVFEAALYMIDFQDARMGCCQYDLASLLRDSYYQLEEEIIYELADYYYNSLEKIEKSASVKIESKKDFGEIFDLMSIQRNFKAIGSFASFYNKRDDVRYLKFVGNTFENVRRNLLKFPELDELRRLLFKYYYF